MRRHWSIDISALAQVPDGFQIEAQCPGWRLQRRAGVVVQLRTLPNLGHIEALGLDLDYVTALLIYESLSEQGCKVVGR
jgi:hypothetical protein